MAYKVIKANLAIDDILDALDYYDAISEELGLRFEKELNEAIDKLEKHPHHYFNLENNNKRINLKSFPYMLIYSIDENKNVVFLKAVFHHSKKPKQF